MFFPVILPTGNIVLIWCQLTINNMSSTSQKQRNRQFGLKLLLIVLVAAVIFSVWYWADKNNRTAIAPAPVNTQSVVN